MEQTMIAYWLYMYVKNVVKLLWQDFLAGFYILVLMGVYLYALWYETVDRAE